MKAAIVQAAGQPPVYGTFSDPVAGEGECIVTVTAAAISQVVKSRASGTHYSSSGTFPFVVGIDGTGRLEDGRRVYFLMPRAPYGGMSEKAVVPATRCLALPDQLDDVTAAAIANPGMSSWAAYTERAKLRAGESVVVNGATGTSGRLAIQIARYLGAGKVIAIARNAEALKSLPALGADVTIALGDDDAALDAALKEQFAEGVDVVIDYLWGKSAERLIAAGARHGKGATPIRYVQVGSMSGADITLPSAALRSSAIELMGSGIGSIPLERLVLAVGGLLRATIPGGFEIASTVVPLSQVGQAWPRDDSRRRTVFTI